MRIGNLNSYLDMELSGGIDTWHTQVIDY